MKRIFVNNQKRAFTLIEIILAVTIATLISFAAYRTVLHNNFAEAIKNTQETIAYIVKEGIASPNGYANGAGVVGDANLTCSPSHDFTALSSTRLAHCVDWDNVQSPRFNVDDTVGFTSNNGHDLMKQYDPNARGCSVNVTADTANAERFYVFVDCSMINFDDSIFTQRSRARLEEAIAFTFQSTLQEYWITTDRDSTNINNSTGGADDDGMLRGHFGL